MLGRRTRRLQISVIAAAVLSLVVGAPAMADTSAGTGGSGGTGGGSGFHWRAAAYSEAGQAWNDFKAAAKQGSELESKIRATGASVEVCKNSQAIWWVQSGVWSWNFTGATHGSGWSGKGSIEKPYVEQSNRAPSRAQVDAFKKWDREVNGKSIDNIPGYTIICSGSFDKKDREFTITETDSEMKDSSYEVTEPYAYTTSVTPMEIEGRYPGNASYEAQPAQTIKTEFAKLYDSLAAKQKLSPKEVEKKVQEALKKDAAQDYENTVTLSDKNKKAFANGGVLNIHEHMRTATIEVARSDEVHKQRECPYIQKWNVKEGKYDEAKPNGKCSPWETVRVDKGQPTMNKIMGTSKQVGFWQMISVHCNADDFKKLIEATGATVLDSGDKNGQFSGVAKSKTYTQQPKFLDFGDSHNLNKDAAASGRIGFYDKECAFECIASPDEADGASKYNDAINNLGVENGGASADSHGHIFEGDDFTFFRDNAAHPFRLDVWYPKSSGVVDYKSDPHTPVTTTVTRWDEGTPDIAVGANGGGQFILKDSKGSEVFRKSSAEAPTQTNWNRSTFSNSTVGILQGGHNTFTAQATWASEKDKPQRMNFKWEYAPAVSTKFPTELGFNKAGVIAKSAKTTAANIEGKCYARFGNSTGVDTRDMFHENTGSGTTNNLDGTLFDPSTELSVAFIRSVGG